MEKKTVKCPKCNTHLAVTNSKGEEQKIISCPRCGTKLRVKFNPQAAPQQPVGAGPATVLPPKPGKNGVPPLPTSNETGYGDIKQNGVPTQGLYETQLAASKPNIPIPNTMAPPCTLALLCNNIRYNLKPGLNRIGRSNKSIPLDIALQIKDLTVSRYAALVEVTGVNDETYRAIISNGQNKNTNFVNDIPLQDGDKVLLADGARIKMGETELIFVNR